MQNKRIVFLASDCDSSRWVFNALRKEFDFCGVIIENPVARKILFKNRVKRLGLMQVTGQALFSLLAVPVIRMLSVKRTRQLKYEFQLDDTAFPSGIFRVPSVNDAACKALLQQLNPDIVVVNGTRIISKSILTSTHARFINMHVGITPAYRGSHGGYWALRNNDADNFGTTIHQVDAGIDTGTVLKQVFVKPASNDTFTTYPVLQVAIGIQALKDVLLQTTTYKTDILKSKTKGKVWYQPTLWDYLLHKTR